MLLLIDGHNLMGQMAGLSFENPNDLVRLVERLRRYSAHTGTRIKVFFDRGLPGGKSRGLSTSGVEVIFASRVTDADRLILRRVRRHHDPAGLTVVSSDLALQQAARAAGAQTLPADEFARRLSAPPPTRVTPDAGPEPEITPDEVEAWLLLFNRRSERLD